MGNNGAKMSPKSFHRNQSKPLPVPAEISDHRNAAAAVFLTPKSSFSDESREIDFSLSGESSVFVCDICAETRLSVDSFSLKGCPHFYCADCVVRYIDSKLDDSVTLISCPVSECGGSLDPEFCKTILPISVSDRWGKALRESSIEDSGRFYCPYKDCSALLTVDTRKEVSGGLCSFCKREVCFKCKAPWHWEISCKKFEKMEKKRGDALLRDLAKRMGWRRCRNCKIYVERSAGCSYMMCRCGYAFCYACGYSFGKFHNFLWRRC